MRKIFLLLLSFKNREFLYLNFESGQILKDYCIFYSRQNELYIHSLMRKVKNNLFFIHLKHKTMVALFSCFAFFAYTVQAPPSTKVSYADK